MKVWIEKLKGLDLKPEMKVLEVVENVKNPKDIETKWIKILDKNYTRLFNIKQKGRKRDNYKELLKEFRKP